MRFIIIKDYNGLDVAVNTVNIVSIKDIKGDICFLMSGDTFAERPIITQFTSIGSAVDYIQQAPTSSLAISMGVRQ